MKILKEIGGRAAAAVMFVVWWTAANQGHFSALGRKRD